jgi:hypothetical protein
MEDLASGMCDASVMDDAEFPVFRLCKFCHRSSRTPNPLSSYVKGKFLKWRREKGRECASCPWFVMSDPEYACLEKDSLEEKCKGEEFRSAYIQKLGKWEESKQATGGGKKYAAQKGSKQVVAHACDKIQAKIFLGWIWPKAIYERVEKEKLEKRQIKSFRVGDKVYRGILRDKVGVPGCIEYSKISDAGATMSGVVASSHDEVENEVADAWTQATKRTRAMVSCDKKDPGAYRVTVPRSKVVDDSSGD